MCLEAELTFIASEKKPSTRSRALVNKSKMEQKKRIEKDIEILNKKIIQSSAQVEKNLLESMSQGSADAETAQLKRQLQESLELVEFYKRELTATVQLAEFYKANLKLCLDEKEKLTSTMTNSILHQSAERCDLLESRTADSHEQTELEEGSACHSVSEGQVVDHGCRKRKHVDKDEQNLKKKSRCSLM